ncbi:hypothetical protein K491DRAFT_775399 [Lophiostoma macrostomum CBS 122681]|uniref:2EXR domain-containing protein n=1 Tax=Lophiostoma macrostomum CBS 122681 TaxID=1314788 RepID=A0A6A6TIY3_9PLEO|nr:hypothetical protein K491DRAFT_775399 [Lophiostoma macrostomum CBS 122681]
MPQLSTSTPSSGRYSKRKRAQVNYYESDSGPEEVSTKLDSQDEVEYPQAKKPKTKAPRPLPKRKVFRFLELPAEIRNMIYGLCFTDPQGVFLISNTVRYRRTVARAPRSYVQNVLDDVSNEFATPAPKPKAASKIAEEPRTLIPSLLAVNKQINKEGRDILYNNHFHVHDPLTLHSFLVDVTHRAAPLLKTITLRHWGGWRGMQKAYNHACFTALVYATNLEKFKINGPMNCKPEPVWVARQIYRDGFSWLEALGSARGRFDAALDVLEVSDRPSWNRWYLRNKAFDPVKDTEDLKQELRRLLDMRTKSVKAKPRKKSEPASTAVSSGDDLEDTPGYHDVVIIDDSDSDDY